MPSFSGQATREEVQEVQEEYGIAEISLLNDTNESYMSGAEFSGSGNYTWTFSYDPAGGFTNQGWQYSWNGDVEKELGGYNDDGVITPEEATVIYNFIYERQESIGIALGTSYHKCSTLVQH